MNKTPLDRDKTSVYPPWHGCCDLCKTDSAATTYQSGKGETFCENCACFAAAHGCEDWRRALGGGDGGPLGWCYFSYPGERATSPPLSLLPDPGDPWLSAPVVDTLFGL